MTTICYKDGILAGDTMATRGSEKTYGVQKVFLTERFLLGVSGSAANILPLVDWFIDHFAAIPDGNDATYLHRMWDSAPNYHDGYSYILVDREGRVFSNTNAPPMRIHAGCDAIGSGAAYAMGAMAFGASAVDAVRVAKGLDAYTGGPIMHVKF